MVKTANSVTWQSLQIFKDEKGTTTAYITAVLVAKKRYTLQVRPGMKSVEKVSNDTKQRNKRRKKQTTNCIKVVVEIM